MPSDLAELVERYAGRARLTARDADPMLADLAQLDQVGRTLVGGVGAPDQVRVDTKGDRVDPKGDLVSLTYVDSNPVEARVEHNRAEEPNLVGAGITESDQVQQPLAPGFLQSSPSDTRDGPLTRRMDARDVRVMPGARKAAFASGLLGADDLPEFPAVRPPGLGKEPEEQPNAVSSTASEQSDSFEILVDEEILEIEPDDAVFDDSPDES